MAAKMNDSEGWLKPEGEGPQKTVTIQGPTMTEDELATCPKCGDATSKGFLVCEAFTEGPKWDTKKTKLGFGGEELAQPSMLGLVHLDARLCTTCRLVMFHY